MPLFLHEFHIASDKKLRPWGTKILFLTIPFLAGFTGPEGRVCGQPADPGRSDDGRMIAYRQAIPGTDISVEMVPVPAGTLRRDDGAAVTLAPFWIGKYEVTCGQYGEFMKMHEVFVEFDDRGSRRWNSERMACRPQHRIPGWNPLCDDADCFPSDRGPC